MADISKSDASPWIAAAVGLLGGVILVAHAKSYPFVTYDDAFISLRYSQRLLDGHGLTWTDGPPVEGYSNLLWVLGCAALAALGVPLSTTPVVLGIASGLAMIAALVVAFAPEGWRDSLPALAAVSFLAASGPIALWAVAGLEGCLVGALLAWALVLLKPLFDDPSAGVRRGLIPGIPLALLCITRPDGPLVTAAICVFLVVHGRSRESFMQAVGVGVLPVAATLGQVAFRLAYYGDWVPNTARAKVAFTVARLESGSACVAEAARSSYALWIPAMVAVYVAWRNPARRSRILLLLALLGTWLLYTSSVTCQAFGYRMLIPCYVLLAFLLGETIGWVQEQGAKATAIAWMATLVLVAWFARAQQNDKNIALARWIQPPVTVQGESIGKALGAAFADADPLVAVDAAGAIPFFSGLRALDMLGLSDAHIARHHGDSFGKGVQGHELGDGAYVLSREPDIIVAGVAGSARLAFRGGREMEANPDYHASYRRVRMLGRDPVDVRFSIHCRLDGRAGVQRTEASMTVPGYLLASAKGTQARLEDGTLVLRFVAPVETSLEGVPFDAGTWRLRVDGDGPISLTASAHAGSAVASPVGDELELVLTEPAQVDLTVRGDPRTSVREVVARRVGP